MAEHLHRHADYQREANLTSAGVMFHREGATTEKALRLGPTRRTSLKRGALNVPYLLTMSVNEFLESVGAPLEILDGFIDSIAVTIPWSALVTENCTVEVSGLQVTCRPKYRQGHAGSESQSWPSSMTTSMQLAQECLKEQTEEPSDASQPLEGLEMFAQTIETVLRRIEVTFVDTVIRVEHTPRSGEAPGVALEIHIKRLDYCDEVVRDPGQAVAVDIHQPPPFVHKILQLSGLLLYYEEFGEGSARGPKEAEPCDSGGEEAGPSPLLQIGSCSGYTEMRIKLKQNEAFPGAKLELDGKIGSLHLLLAPRQILHLTDLLSSLNLSESGLLQEQLSKNRPLDSEDLKLIEQDLSQQLHSGLGSAPPHLEGMAAGVENGEMFFSMAPMTSSVASLRSVSDVSDLDSSVHSDISTAPLQPPAFAPGLSLGSPRRYRRLPFASTLPGLNKIPSKAGPFPPPSLDSQRPEMPAAGDYRGPDLDPSPSAPWAFPSDVLSLGVAQRFFLPAGGPEGRSLPEAGIFIPCAVASRRPFHAAMLTGAAVQLTCERKSSKQLRGLNWDASFGLLEILECLWPASRRTGKPEYTQLLVFPTPGPVPYSQAPQPCARIRSKHLEKLPSSKSGLAKGALSKLTVELAVELADFLSEVDLGTLDRLCSLLQPAMVPSRPGVYRPEEPVPGFPPAARWQGNMQLVAPKASLLLQFPIPDLRAWAERRAWAEKAVRRERLRLDLAGVELRTDLEPTGPTKLEITLTDLHGIYEDGETLSVPCFRVGKAPDLLARGVGKKYLLPKLILTFCPTPTDAPWDLVLAAAEEVELSTVESPCELKQPEPSPFSSKRTMYETEEMVIPGDPEEMAEFQSQTLAASRYTLELTFPTVHIFLNPCTTKFRDLHNVFLHHVSDLPSSSFVFSLVLDYVCVVEVDLLELVITTWKGATAGKLTRPLFELRCSNNVVHIHTCADSCAALGNLIQYVVNKGDQHPPPRHDSPTEIAGQKVQLSESPASLPTCPPAETAAINQRDLTDALMDTERGYQEMTGDSGMRRQPSPVSVYLFPGENGAAGQGKAPPPPGTPVAEGLDFSPSEDSEGESEATDGFCILDAPGTGIPPRDGEPVVTKLLEGPVHIQEGHFSRPLGSTDLLKAPSHFPVPESRVVMREISVVWHLYGGRDFGPGRSPSGHMHSPRTKSSLPSTRSSPSRSSVSSRPQSSWRAQGGPGRIHDLLMEIQLTKVSFQHESYSTGASEKPSLESEEQPLARQVFVVQELEIRDRLASSQINKFLYLYSSELLPRRAHSNMLTIKALHVCPEAGVGGPECCLRVSLMPLRLNIDQDALFFLKDFFTSVAASINPVVPMEVGPEGRVESPGKDSEAAERMMATSVETTTSENSSSASSSSEQPIYFREFRFTSEVPIWLDYHGKHVTVDQVGTFAGILIGLAQLNCSELKLKRLCCRHGLLGVEKVVSYTLTEWLTDIRKNQLPGILGGVGPMHSFVQLFHGLRDLFWLPIEQYRKDGRIIRGLQRGAASFGTSTASAALELSNRLVQAIQATAETVYDILSPTAPPSRTLPDRKYARKLRRGHQPADLREGVAKAYDTVREGVIDTAQAICDVAARGHEQKGITGAVGGVLRQIPPTVVKPLIVASEATSNLLGGMRNQIKPDALKEESLKGRWEEPGVGSLDLRASLETQDIQPWCFAFARFSARSAWQEEEQPDGFFQTALGHDSCHRSGYSRRVFRKGAEFERVELAVFAVAQMPF
ncbi:autophagy-related protein 2 homolog A [Pantherophis guttatus]|uniref:Autophagy-related protein 2 homolog A n=1 Tax=Pantherophis guttatus TaxID=94885 RepID=A0ABM3YQW7_PANGU|nr:autophagy-related protein 2 homolog A [Pantherophis guttatus]